MIELYYVLLLLKGVVVGFLIATPVGPVGLLCIRRSIVDGRLAAFGAGLGAAVADTAYGAVAGFGLHFISDFLLAWRVPLTVGGGALLLVMAWSSWRKPIAHLRIPSGLPKDQDARRRHGWLRDFGATLLLTLTNPATILAFMAVFATFGMVDLAEEKVSGGVLILGVFTGSSLWWLTLSALADAASRRLIRTASGDKWLAHLNQGAAALLGIAAVGVLASALIRFS